jgi:hypothetical protein
MPNMGQLRSSAKGLGIPSSAIRGATSAEELQALIMDYMNGTTTKPTRKPTTKTRTATKTATKPVRRGRPPKAATTTAVKSKPAAKSTTTGKAKRSTADDSGRKLLGAVDFSETDGWKAREGSPPDLIVKALRRFKGNREKVFTHLLPNIWEFVGRKMQDGTKRSQSSAETMLKYRISRTAWDFAMKTGQHEKSSNRVEYGTGGTGSSKPRKAAGAARTTAKAKTGTTRAKTTARPQKAAQKPAEAPKRRGRPPGSKNKPKVAATTTAKKPVAKKKTARR